MFSINDVSIPEDVSVHLIEALIAIGQKDVRSALDHMTRAEMSLRSECIRAHLIQKD